VAENTALARLEQSASQSITTPQTLAAKVREWSELAHVLTPAVQISAIAPQHAVNVAVVVLDTRIDEKGIGTDTYGPASDGRGVPWMKQGERAPSKTGLLKIAAAAGVSWVPELSGRTDDGKTPFYWCYKSVATVVDFDGSRRVLPPGTFEVDLRDGSPSLKGFTPNQIDQARKSGLRMAESKAMNAAIRTLGLRQKYTAKELEKPFVILRTSFVPDMGDPMQRRLVAERALGGATALYGQPRQIEAGAPVHDVIDVEAEHVTTSATTVQTSTPTNGGSQGQTSQAQAPAEPSGPTITDVKPEKGVTAEKRDAQGTITSRGGKPWTRYVVTLSDGRVVYTFSASIGDQAEKFRADKTPVDVTTTETRFGHDILELRRATAPLPFDDGPTEAEVGPKL